MPEKHPKPKTPLRRLNLDLLDHVEKEILEGNRKQLVRSESMDRIKFRVKTYQPEDQIIRLARRNTLARRRPSVPRKLDFELYKTENSYDRGKEENEREWTRGIWNKWFDEVIPLLDGTFARDPRNRLTNDDDNDDDSIQVEGIRFNDIVTSLDILLLFFVVFN